jgi:hypothetical protein
MAVRGVEPASLAEGLHLGGAHSLKPHAIARF